MAKYTDVTLKRGVMRPEFGAEFFNPDSLVFDYGCWPKGWRIEDDKADLGGLKPPPEVIILDEPPAVTDDGFWLAPGDGFDFG